MRRGSHQSLRLVLLRDLGQLARPALGRLEVAYGDGDLDERLQEAAALRQADGIVQRTADGRERSRSLAPREEQQRAPRLRIARELVGRVESLLRLRQLAQPEADLADLVQRRAGQLRRPVAQLVARQGRALLGLGELAFE